MKYYVIESVILPADKEIEHSQLSNVFDSEADNPAHNTILHYLPDYVRPIVKFYLNTDAWIGVYDNRKLEYLTFDKSTDHTPLIEVVRGLGFFSMDLDPNKSYPTNIKLYSYPQWEELREKAAGRDIYEFRLDQTTEEWYEYDTDLEKLNNSRKNILDHFLMRKGLVTT